MSELKSHKHALSYQETSELEPLPDRQRIIKTVSEIAVLSAIEIARNEQREDQQETIADFKARPYQIDAWSELENARKSGKDRGLINLATGLGKTTVATFDYAMFRKESLENNKSAKGLFVVHQNNILSQAGKSFQKLMPDLNIKKYRSAKSDSLDADFNLATFQSLAAGIKNGSINEHEFDYIIYDEAHHIEAETYKQVVEHLKPTFQLGLTATPKRMDEKDITDHFGEALYTKTLPEAIVDGYLATVEYNIMIDDAVQQMIDENFNPETMADINELFSYEPRNEEIVKNIIEEQEKIKSIENTENIKTIIFCSDKEHADDVARLMNGASYHSGIKEQDSILDSFRNGDINTITTVDMFNEGVDIPDTRMIVFLRTTQSPNIFEQQLGRGLRKTAGKDRVSVLDFVANINRVAQINELRNEISKITADRKKQLRGFNNETPDDNPFIHTSDFSFDKRITNLLEQYYNGIEAKNILYQYSNDELAGIWNKKMPGILPTKRSIAEMNKFNQFMCYKTLVDRFDGSLNNFQTACGYEATRNEKRTSLENTKFSELEDQELIALWHKDMAGIMPTRKLIDSLSMEGKFLDYSDLRNRFGGKLINFQKACGYEPFDFTSLDNEGLVALWHKIMPGTMPTKKLINKLSAEDKFISRGALHGRFEGKLINFQIACGYTPESKPNFINLSPNELVVLWNEIMPGVLPTNDSIDELSRDNKFLCANTLRKRFNGRLIDFQIACGYIMDSQAMQNLAMTS